MKLLLIEDTIELAKSIAGYLTQENYICEVAHTFDEARERLVLFTYDCIILDIRMPDVDGIELTRRLRAREKEQNVCPVPIIACTGDTESSTEKRCLAAGIKAVLAKPLNLDKFAQILTELGSSALPDKTPAPSCQIADRIVADMGRNTARIEEYLQLLQEDIHWALDQLEQAIATDDRQALKAAAHTLKGLCGHLREKGPELLVLRLHNGALTLSSTELRHEAALLRSTCAQLLLKDQGDGK